MALEIITLTIPAGEVLSNSQDMRNGRLNAVIMPPEWDGQYITLQMSFSTTLNPGPAWYDVHDANGREIITTVVPGTVVIDPTILAGHMRIRSGTAERPVPQKAARQFIIIFDPSVDFGTGPQQEKP